MSLRFVLIQKFMQLSDAGSTASGAFLSGSRTAEGEGGVVIKGVAVKTILFYWLVALHGAPSECGVGT